MKCKMMLTPRVVEEMQKSDAFTKEINQAAKLFQRGDWGLVSAEDKEANDSDLKNECGHVLGMYATKQGMVYIEMGLDQSEKIAVIMFDDER